MRKYITLFVLWILIILFIDFSYNSSGTIFTPQITSNVKDSVFGKSHDLYPQFYIKDMPNSQVVFSNTHTFQNSLSLFNNINITRDSFPQNEPSVKISRKNPNRIVAAWRDFRTGVDPALRRVGYSYSSDGGVTWANSALLLPFSTVYSLASDPAVSVDTAGNFYISTISMNTARLNLTVIVYKSTNEGVSFDQAFNIAPHADTGHFVDDKEYITCDLVTGSPYRNNLYVTWASDSGDVIVRSTDGGLNWSNRIHVVSDGGGTGLVPAVGIGRDLYVVWVGGSNNGPYGIYINKSTDGGLQFNQEVLISPVVDHGFLIRLPSIAVDISGGIRNGNIYTVWSNPYNSTGDEDVFFSYSMNRSNTWSTPKRVNNDSIGTGKQHYFPWIAVNETGNISIVFYDTRNTPNNNIIEAYLASSTDGGQTFTNVLLSTQQSPVNYPNSDVRFGDYIGIDSWNNKTIPVWTDERAGGFNSEIYTATVRDTIIGILPISSQIPEYFSLFQNYPNPFNPSTKIKFNIPLSKGTANSTDVSVQIKIYDILGRQVAILVNEELKAGSYQIDWNAANYSSGLYFYKIEAGDFVDIKKMVLIK